MLLIISGATVILLRKISLNRITVADLRALLKQMGKSAVLGLGILLLATLFFNLLAIYTSFRSTPTLTSVVLIDYGWIRVNKSITIEFVNSILAGLHLTNFYEKESDPLDHSQLEEIISSSGGSVQTTHTALSVAVAITAVCMAGKFAGVSPENFGLFATTNPKFAATVAVLGLISGFRLYYRGLVGLCPLHTTEDTVWAVSVSSA